MVGWFSESERTIVKGKNRARVTSRKPAPGAFSDQTFGQKYACKWRIWKGRLFVYLWKVLVNLRVMHTPILDPWARKKFCGSEL